MRAGRLRHRLRIEEPSVQKRQRGRSGGRKEEKWKEVITVWGELEHLEGRELEFARQKVSVTTHMAKIRYLSRPKITTRMRITNNDRVFHIEDVGYPEFRPIKIALLLTEKQESNAVV